MHGFGLTHPGSSFRSIRHKQNEKLDVALSPPPGCRPAAACLDYRAFLFSLEPPWPEPAYARLCDTLRGLGRIRREALGVTYVDGEWGFLVIPPPGFPELKINFHHGAPDPAAQTLLDRIDELLRDARMEGRGQTDQTESSEQR